MVEIQISEEHGYLIVNGPALQLLTGDEIRYLGKLGMDLKQRLKEAKDAESNT